MKVLKYAIIFFTILTINRSKILQAQVDVDGVWIGKLHKTTEINRGYGRIGPTLKFKLPLHKRINGQVELILPFRDRTTYPPIVQTENDKAVFHYTEHYTYSRTVGCRSEYDVSFYDVLPKSATVEVLSKDYCSNGAYLEILYKGTLKRITHKENFNALDHTYGVTKCFTVKKPITFDWEFYDQGGVLADFELRLFRCNSNRGRTLVKIRKFVQELYRYGSFTIRERGRYYFEVESTDDWEIDRRY